ncbi:Protein zds1 [Pseudocercospora fuligena]|uniref:Protein zds1 n=1 Tax=Pseudocercospora fuligena TaxID=685502 RepID=A0A8H6VQU1_9PEZI|nr:Protein zds1 [Pseudocercospora fuligena]
MAARQDLDRRQELERVYQARKNSKKHSPQLSISDDNHHVTEAIGSWYEEAPTVSSATSGSGSGAGSGAGRLGGGGGGLGVGIGLGMGMSNGDAGHSRPLSYINAPSERESFEARRQRRHGTLLDAQAGAGTPNSNSSSNRRVSPPPSRAPLARAQSNEKLRSPTESAGHGSPKPLHRMASHGSENVSSQNSPTSPPPLSRQSSTDTAVQHFPLNDIDYESSPAAVAQELSNLQAIRRMSMNVDTADPDLPSFSPVAPKQDDDDESDPSKLFWVPARLHPELAPKEFKTFIEDRVDKIRRRSGGEDSLSPDGISRSGSGSSLQRKKSMLSHQIDTKGSYEDGAERLERKRSKGMTVEGQTTVANLSDLETLVNDPAQLMRRMSLDNQRRSQDSGNDLSSSDDVPILPPVGTLKRSTRTTYRRGSLKKGERVPFSKRAAHRHIEPESEDVPPSPTFPNKNEPALSLTRVQTEPIPPPKDHRESHPRSETSRRNLTSQSEEDLPREEPRDYASTTSRRDERFDERDHPQPQPAPSQQPRQFQSRIASPGRTTAQLPGYNNTNPLPQIIETLPDGTKVPASNLMQGHPERKSSHELPRHFQRGGAHMRPVPGREKATSSTLDDISSHPSPLPGSGATRTDALTMVPTFDEKKAEKQGGGRKSSWKWFLGADEDKRSKEEVSDSSSSKSKAGKLSKNSTDKARLDVLQNSIDGNVPARGRESLVLNRDEIKLEEERKKESKKTSDPGKEKSKEPGLLSAIFGGKKKTSDGDLKEKKRRVREHSPEPPARILKPDIDYNWTRFSILEERAIYRMAHIKLANPRRALYSQVLLSNFMYSYLAKEQARQEAANNANSDAGRTSFDMVHEGQMNYESQQQQHSSHQRRASQDRGQQSYSSHSGNGSNPRTNGAGANGTNSQGYSVATTHEYLGYSKSEPFSSQQGLWNEREVEEELW